MSRHDLKPGDQVRAPFVQPASSLHACREARAAEAARQEDDGERNPQGGGKGGSQDEVTWLRLRSRTRRRLSRARGPGRLVPLAEPAMVYLMQFRAALSRHFGGLIWLQQ